MVIYVATVWARPGQEQEVTRIYQDIEPLMRAAQGFRSRRILRAKTGAMAVAVRSARAAGAAGGGHAEPPGPAGTHFVTVEEWDSIDDRIAFAMSAAGGRGKQLIPLILPEHSHEFYEDVSPPA